MYFKMKTLIYNSRVCTTYRYLLRFEIIDYFILFLNFGIKILDRKKYEEEVE